MKGGVKNMFKMKRKCKCNKPALVVGLFVAILHALWALIVAVGMGQAKLDWIFLLHFIDNSYTVIPFNLLNAVLLIGLSFVGSYLATLLFVVLWKHVKVK
jgi:hypothetical protein